jgi:hypothetical protein
MRSACGGRSCGCVGIRAARSPDATPSHRDETSKARGSSRSHGPSCRWSDRRVRRRPLQGFRSSPRLFRAHVAVRGTTLPRLSCLSKRSDRRSGVMGCRSLLAVSTAARCSVDRPCRVTRTRCGGFRRLRRPLRVRVATSSPVQSGPDRPSWGFAPLQRRRPGRSVRRGFASPATVPPSEFLAPSAGCSPSGLADMRSPLPLLGFRLEGPFEREGRDAFPRPLRPLDSGATRPRALASTRPHASDSPRRLSPHALVPRPWSQDFRDPLRSSASPSRGGGFRRRRPLLRFSPRRLGEP